MDKGKTENQVTIGFKTFLRPIKLQNCLTHIKNLNEKPKKVIIVDDTPSPRRSHNEEIYDNFKDKLNLTIIKPDTKIGLAKGRNIIFENTETEYLLMIDDDLYLPPNIIRSKIILEKNKEIGGVSYSLLEKGKKVNKPKDIKFKDGWILFGPFDKKKVFKKEEGIRYSFFDFITNPYLFRVECLKDYSWDDHYKIAAQHEDFHIGHKLKNDWKFALAPDFVVEHNHGSSKFSDYLSYRKNLNEIRKDRKYLAEKWNAKGFLTMGYYGERYKSKFHENLVNTYYSFPKPLRWDFFKRGFIDRAKLVADEIIGERLG